MRYNSNIYVGLSDEQVRLRYEEGLVNYDTEIKTISIKKIIYKNIFVKSYNRTVLENYWNIRIKDNRNREYIRPIVDDIHDFVSFIMNFRLK